MAAPALYIRSERTGVAWQVWPQPDPVPPGVVQEMGNYLFELKDSPEATGADLLIDERALEALRTPAPNAARWRWSPGFHAGTIEAELRIPGRAPRRFEVITDADSRKLTRDAFDAMVREILEDTFALFCEAQGQSPQPLPGWSFCARVSQSLNLPPPRYAARRGIS
jgi:hypothetical protein